MGWDNYTDHVSLENDGALRTHATVGVHHGLAVNFKTLRAESAR